MSPIFGPCARSAVIGGALRIAASFVPHIPASPWLEAYYAVIDICLLLGLIGIYGITADKLGNAGRAGFAVALIGQASIIGPDAAMFGIDFYVTGSLLLLAGLSIWSLALLRAGLMRIVAACWLLSAGCAVAAGISGSAGFVPAAGVALGLGFVLAGLSCITRQARARGTALFSVV